MNLKIKKKNIKSKQYILFGLIISRTIEICIQKRNYFNIVFMYQ